ncbi:hypothetical protein TeGR_g801, partial [Tetraparma gracilis]
PFFLNPHTKPEGENLMEHLKSKYGEAAVERFGKPGNPLDVAGEKVGITFDKDRRVIQTLDCHRVMEFMREQEGMAGKTEEFMENMFQAYFERGEDLSKRDVLLAVAGQTGLDTDVIGAMLESDAHKEDVRIKDMSHKQTGVSGVPFFYVGGYKFSGAQPPETFEEIIDEVYDGLETA